MMKIKGILNIFNKISATYQISIEKENIYDIL